MQDGWLTVACVWCGCVGQETEQNEEGGGVDVMSRRARALSLLHCTSSLTRLDSTWPVRVCGVAGCVLVLWRVGWCGVGAGRVLNL